MVMELTTSSLSSLKVQHIFSSNDGDGITAPTLSLVKVFTQDNNGNHYGMNNDSDSGDVNICVVCLFIPAVVAG